MIKITNDNIEDEKGNHPEVSKEKNVFIPGALYPNDYHTQFENIKDNEYLMGKIDECWSRSKELKKGDQVKCSVFIVEEETRNGVTTYVINRRSTDIKVYADFDLWLYPDPESFKRLEVDSRESLKFRKQWFYTCKNREKCEEITGSKWNDYRYKGWINKNPKIIFPILWGIRLGTAASNLWGRLTRQENLPKDSITHKFTIIGIIVTTIGIIVTTIGIIVGIISIAVAIWF